MVKGINIRVLAEIQNVKWFRLVDNQTELLTQGLLKICSLSEQHIYYINIGDYYFTIQKQIPFICAPFKTHRTYIFPHMENGFNAISIEYDFELITQLEIILSNVGELITKEILGKDEELLNSFNIHCQNIFKTPLIDDDRAIFYIKKSGNFLKDKFMNISQITASRVDKAGEYIESKITPSQSVELSPKTKEKINNIKDATQKTLIKTYSLFNSFVSPFVSLLGKMANQVSNKIDSGKIQTLKKIKNLSCTTIDATSHAFGGLKEGVIEVANSIQENALLIIEKKYGDDIVNTLVGDNNKEENDKFET